MERKVVRIITAMKEEAFPFLERLEQHPKTSFDDFQERRFYFGKYKDTNFSIFVSGVGKVMAASAAQRVIGITQGDTQYILHFGVAGKIDNSLKVGDIVLPKKIIEYDLETSLGFKQKHEVDIQNKYAEMFEKFLSPKTGIALSGEKDIVKSEDRDELWRKYGALSADWESYAVAKVCEMMRVPCVVLRIISDNSDQSSLELYDKNLPIVSKNLADKILSFYDTNPQSQLLVQE